MCEVKTPYCTDASYHCGSEGNVVNERRRQSWDPHHQDNGYGQALVLRHRLWREIIRVTDKCDSHRHSDEHSPPQPNTHSSQTHQLGAVFVTEPPVGEQLGAGRMKLFECVTWAHVLVFLRFISELCHRTAKPVLHMWRACCCLNPLVIPLLYMARLIETTSTPLIWALLLSRERPLTSAHVVHWQRWVAMHHHASHPSCRMRLLDIHRPTV